MIKELIMIAGGLVGGIIFVFVKNKVFSVVKKEVEEKVGFDSTKFVKGVLGLGNQKQEWSKTVAQELSLRTWATRLAIIGIIIGCVYGYGWWKGHQGVQPVLNWHGKEEWVSLNDHYLHINTDGSMEILDSDKKTVLKKLTVKDFENLKKNSRPYGFIAEPIAVVGASMGTTGTGVEGGVGLSWFKWFKAKLDSFLTNRGVYPLGVSYSITENSGAGLGYGYGYKGDQRVILYYKFKF